MQHVYDGQIKRYLTQFMRLMSNFSYKDAKGKIVQVPVRYGDMNRQVAQIMKKNSENVIASAPFIACYIKSMDLARDRLQDPTFVSKINIRERAYDENGEEYLNTQGANYTIERLMPTPYTLQFTADIWTTNTDQKLQLLEQMLVLFNPSMEIQTNNNYVDWTSLSLVELTGLTFSSRSVPQGLEQDIDIATLNFTSPIWLTTPSKVKKLGVITKIITSIFDEETGSIAAGKYKDGTDVDYFTGRTPVSVDVTTLGNYNLLVLDNTARLVPPNGDTGETVNWNTILEAYPGQFTAGLSSIRLQKTDGNEIVGNLSLDPSYDYIMRVNFDDQDTLPQNTIIEDLDGLYPRGTVDAIVNPETFNPRPTLPNGTLGWPAVDARYLILEDVDSTATNGPEAWRNQDDSPFSAQTNDVVQWDGAKWNNILISAETQAMTYITNARTGVQYVWDGENWMKSFEGMYTPGQWRLVL